MIQVVLVVQLSRFNTFFRCCEVKVPDQSHKAGEEDSVLDWHKVNVDKLRDCPDLPVGK